MSIFRFTDESDALGSVTRGRLLWRRVSYLGREYAVILSFLVLLVVLSTSSNVFLTRENIGNLADQYSATGIIAVGGTLVLIGGGFDLSVGAIYAVAGVVAAQVMNGTGSLALSIVAACAIGAGCGLGNGIGVNFFRINPFVTTLATSLIISSLALYLSGGLDENVTNFSFTHLGQGTWFTVKISVWALAAFAAFAWILLDRTIIGRFIYAAGGNPEAARLAGVPVGAIKTLTYVISGLSAGLGGVIVASRIGTGAPDVGADIPLQAIAAIVVGGTSIFGGEGAIWRTMFGVYLLAMIGNGFNLLNVNAVYQQMAEGAIILGAVGLDAWFRTSRRSS
jgi:ribose transport system permease protein